VERVRLALPVLAALLAMTGTAAAALPSGNIVVNGDAEAGPSSTNQTDAPAPSGWQTVPNFTSVAYGSSGFPTTAISGQIGGGSNFFSGGPDAGFAPSSAIVQDIDLAASAADLDRDDVSATLSADLGGNGSQGDSASVAVVFVDAAQSGGTGAVALQPVTPEDRGNQTGFVHRSSCAKLNPGTRTAHVQVSATSAGGSYNDGYADNVRVTLSTAPCPAPSAELPPPSSPVPGATGNITPAGGHVLIRTPGSKQFQEVTKASSIPVGSELNTENGKVKLQTAADLAGKVQSGTFSGARFVLKQKPAQRLFTDLLMTGGRLNKCPKGHRKAVVAARRRPGRRLFSTAHGRFRTRGRYSSATVRGTTWVQKDTCSGTTTSVRRGTVVVRDLVKRKTVRVKAGHSYTARPRKR
jgi:hypothetical protein